MKSNKQLGIGILIATFAFLAIAAFPPTWNGGQFQSVGGVFSHTNNGNLGTNMTAFSALNITNNGFLSPTLSLNGNDVDLSQIVANTNDFPIWKILFEPDKYVVQSSSGGDILQIDQGTATAIWIQSDNDTVITNGNLVVGTLGKGLQIKTGANATAGIATLTAGTVTVSTTAVTANSMIFLTKQAGAGGNRSPVEKGTVVAGTSFVIQAVDSDGVVNTSDTSTVAWMIVEPAP